MISDVRRKLNISHTVVRFTFFELTFSGDESTENFLFTAIQRDEF